MTDSYAGNASEKPEIVSVNCEKHILRGCALSFVTFGNDETPMLDTFCASQEYIDTHSLGCNRKAFQLATEDICRTYCNTSMCNYPYEIPFL